MVVGERELYRRSTAAGRAVTVVGGGRRFPVDGTILSVVALSSANTAAAR
jgi:hypothetical protein